ncbi:MULTISPECIES: efflux RND transporter permease subunit [Hydrocarboniphaga]|jgi:multidrug efflux pump|uniref:Acriflavin resistance protein n=3 Tax=Hydrocarboniphaga effusa TaxID=243629 RepID=I8TAA5_9GAMM|nr:MULTISPECIES: efflux RND transporter permease subunit [Hydrocarboniphaga]EIT70620.1 acriflavin resistance protein [Hydrocarboniphaga effusa AP103]MDZ4081247.1 efflux RND transporter permease subunit [Hydrocarboniphaga sp.]
MHFTDIFIKRPVLATVVSLVILLLGLRAAFNLTVREYPFLQNAQIQVSVAYPGADPALVEGFVTTPLEREIASASGIDYLTSSTQQSLATITANLRLDKNPNEAMTEISAKVNKLRNQLPQGSEDPIIQIAEGGGTAAMYLSFYSETLDKSQITDYIERIVQPQLVSIPGIETASIQGQRIFAMRVWLKADRLTAYNLTASEVYARLRAQNVLSAVGETKGNYVKIGLSAQTDLRTPEEFRQMIVKADGDTVVRLGDVADVVLGSETYEGGAGWNGSPALFVAINIRPDANVLDVADAVNKMWPGIVGALPKGLEAVIGYDSTDYIRDAISEVIKTLVEAVVIVIVVIFLFLGSMRNSLIPAVTVPLSLVGALFIMLIMGFTINLLTLLAMVLAIGMVVDDAIIVMENVHRHIEEGLAPFDAAIKGGRELLGPVIAMTITLIAVYAPIGFLSGITGKLFSEFAFTLAGAVLISGVIALTLTPMMCAKLLKPTHGEGARSNRLAAYLDAKFESWRQAYKARLHGALDTKFVILVFGTIVFISCYFLFRATPSELAPEEDPGFAMAIVENDGYATEEYQEQYFKPVQKIALAHPEVDRIFTFSMTTSQGFMGLVTKPWTERTVSTQSVLQELGPQFNQIAGTRVATIVPPPLPTPGQGYPVEFVLKSTADPMTLARVGDEVIGRAMAAKKFFYVAPMLRIDRPEAVVEIDREKAALMGVDMSQLSSDLSALLAGGEVNRFSYQNRSYKVIQQIQRGNRLNPDQLEGYYTRAATGELVPISTLVRISDRIQPRSIEHAQQLNSNTIVAVPRPDITQGEALALLESIAKEVMPANFQIDYAGGSRQFKQEGSALLAVFGFAVIMIYLVLAAQFESFRDPLIMLVTVPMSICGALVCINVLALTNGMQISHFPGMTLNIYTQVGLITLIGVISKHGILIVEFANKLQEQGYSRREAIEEASSIRLRPVLMTTAALVIAMVPLLTASGPGAAARFSMGLVIASGMTIGTLFTLYVVPAMYLYLARDHAKLQPVARAT